MRDDKLLARAAVGVLEQAQDQLHARGCFNPPTAVALALDSTQSLVVEHETPLAIDIKKRVLAPSTGEMVGVAPGATQQRIVAIAACQGVISRTTLKVVVATLTVHGVIATSAIEMVCKALALQLIGIITAKEVLNALLVVGTRANEYLSTAGRIVVTQVFCSWHDALYITGVTLHQFGQHRRAVCIPVVAVVQYFGRISVQTSVPVGCPSACQIRVNGFECTDGSNIVGADDDRAQRIQTQEGGKVGFGSGGK